MQTLSRLNRAHPKKHDVFVLDFLNDADTIRDAFADFYRATILAGETDPDKLHDLQADLDAAQVYSPEQLDDLVQRYLGGADRDELDPILGVCVARYVHELDEDAQVDFKGKAKAFVRTYGFLSCVLPYTNAEWEKRSIFLNFLISKLPAPAEEDLSKGILDAIDMDSYRVEKRAVQQILLPDEDAEIEPVPTTGGGHVPEPELDRLSNILQAFNDLFRDIAWDDRDRVGELITKTIPAKVAADAAFRNARQNSDDANARIEHDKGARPDRHRHGEGRRRAVQAVHGQRGLQAVDDGPGVRAGVRGSGRAVRIGSVQRHHCVAFPPTLDCESTSPLFLRSGTADKIG